MYHVSVDCFGCSGGGEGASEKWHDQADVDLTLPLTILTGANNSGKTCVAWSIYEIIRCKILIGRGNYSASMKGCPAPSFDRLAATALATLSGFRS